MCWFYFEGLTTFDEPWHVDRPTRWTLLRLVNYLTQVPETISPFLFAKSSWFQPYRVACGDKFSFKWLWSLFFPTDRFSYRLLGPLSSLWILWIGWIWTFPLKLAAAALSSCRVSLHDRCVGVLPPVSRSCLPWFLLWARPGKGSMGIFFFEVAVKPGFADTVLYIIFSCCMGASQIYGLHSWSHNVSIGVKTTANALMHTKVLN